MERLSDFGANIVTGIDFMGDWQNVFGQALALARLTEAKLHLVHVLEPPNKALRSSLDEQTLALHQRHILENAEKRLAVAAAETDGIPVTVKVLKGNPAEALLGYVERVKAGLVVCGLSASEGSGFFVGTHADLIIRNCKVPVLVTGPWPVGPFMRILVPTDLDRPDEAAFRVATGITIAQGKGRIRALHVHERPTVLHGYLGNVAALRKNIRDHAKAALDKYIRKLELRERTSNITQLLRPGSDAVHAAEVIVAEAERCRADLIVMALGKRKLLQALHIGGTAEKVLRRLPCSFLALPVDWARKR